MHFARLGKPPFVEVEMGVGRPRLVKRFARRVSRAEGVNVRSAPVVGVKGRGVPAAASNVFL